MTSPLPLSRRTALALGGATMLGASTVALTACGSNKGGGGAAFELPTGATVAKLSDIPVGGTASATVDGHPLLLAQPTAGKVVCFSAICTHRGCTVDSAAHDFECPCHGSTYAAATGDVTHGPAERGLGKIDVTVAGDTVVVA